MEGMTFPHLDLKERQDRLEGTCTWMLKKSEYVDWTKKPGLQLLAVTGEPGIGKSTVAASLVEQFQAERTTGSKLAYFFCDSSDPKRDSATCVLRVLLSQLVTQEERLCKHVVEGEGRYSERGSTCFKKFDILWRMFIEILEDDALGDATIIVDGLDEIHEKERDFIDKLEEYVRSQSEESPQTRIRRHIGIVFFSQPLYRLDKIIRLHLRNTRHIRITRSDISQDLTTFINENVNAISSDWDPDLSKEVHRRLRLEGSHEGTFLWVSLFIKQLKNCNLKLNPDAAVETLLNSYPDGLNDVYLRILKEINRNTDEVGAAKFILQIVLSGYQLTTTQLAILLCFSAEVRRRSSALPNDHQIDTAMRLLRSCDMLLVIDTEDVQVPIKPLHGSVTKFLRDYALPSDLIGYRPSQQISHRYISDACNAYLQSITLTKITKDAFELEDQLKGSFDGTGRIVSGRRTHVAPISLWNSVTNMHLALFHFACDNGRRSEQQQNALAYNLITAPHSFRNLKLLAAQQGHESIVRVLQIVTKGVDVDVALDLRNTLTTSVASGVVYAAWTVATAMSFTPLGILTPLVSLVMPTLPLTMLAGGIASAFAERDLKEHEKANFLLQMIEGATTSRDNAQTSSMFRAIVQPADYCSSSPKTLQMVFGIVMRRLRENSQTQHINVSRSVLALLRTTGKVDR
jgi:nucleoside-triphosphatase THEP1